MNNYKRNDKEQLELIKGIVDDSLSYVYVCDTTTYELLYVNERMAQLTDKPIEEAYGKPCYNYIKNSNRPCEDCYINTSMRNEYSMRMYNSPTTGRCFMCRGKIIDWQGHDALIEYLSDETDRVNQTKKLEDMLNNIPGGVGIYNCYDDGRIEQVYLNDGYYAIIGAKREDRDEYRGFSVFKAIYPDDVRTVFSTVNECIKNNKQLDIDVRVLTANDTYKWFNIKASISSKTNDKTVLYAFYSDIDTLKTTQLELEASRSAISVASNAKKLSFWVYYIDEKRIEHNFLNESPFGFPQTIENMPDTIIGTGDIHPSDEKKYLQLYEDLLNNLENTETTIRIRNRFTKQYEWIHTVYTRLSDDLYGKRVAVGFAANADVEQEMMIKYNNEVQLRLEMIKNSLFYYQLNLSTNIYEEYHTTLNDNIDILPGDERTVETTKQIVDNIYKDDRQLVINNLFSEALIKMYYDGKTSNSIVYRRYINDSDLIWVKTVANIIEKPISHELIVSIYCVDMDNEIKNRLSVEKTIDTDIDTIGILNIHTKQIRHTKIKKVFESIIHSEAQDFQITISQLVNDVVYSADYDICTQFFNQSYLEQSLQDKDEIFITYRVQESEKIILRKKARAFYLDEFKQEIIIVTQDITDLYEEEQKHKFALEEAMKKANQANIAKSEFLSRMSHDIRTPLTAIIALSSNELTTDATTIQKDEYLTKINTSGNYLLGLVNDVLDMSKIESKKITLISEPYSFNDFKNTIETIISEQCKVKNITFKIIVDKDHKECIMTDKVRFNQIMINLLSNAIKFTHSGGEITLQVIHLRDEGNKSIEQFIVSDTGIGMSQDFLPHCFETFTQELRKDSDNSTQGTGLGLPIVKQIVELMGGTIIVDSEINKGTTFTITLPLEEKCIESKNTCISSNKQIYTLEGLKILLCEDNKINSEIIYTLLTKKGCLVDTALNGLIGLEKVKASKENYYDTILMDIRMPIMDGFEATKEIKVLDRNDVKVIPIIALTADAFDSDIRLTKEAGMAGHLAKPINIQELFDTILSCCNKR